MAAKGYVTVSKNANKAEQNRYNRWARLQKRKPSKRELKKNI